MTYNTDTDDLSIYMGLIYRSMRYVTLGVTIMRYVTLGVTIMITTLIFDTGDQSMTGVFATCS